MDPLAHKINTRRLRPLCQRTSRTVMSILENGDISMEILARLPPGKQDGSQTVQEMVHISGDGSKVQLYQNNQGTASAEGQESQSWWTHQEFVYPHLPPKQLKKYIHAYRFVELVKSKTAKIILTTDRAKCKLMENSPTPDFQADFHDGMSIQLSKRKVHVTDADGNSATSEKDSLSHFPDNIVERYQYTKQCESECLRLVSSFSSLETNAECRPLLFPVSIGTPTSPVVIPIAQQTSSPSDSSSIALFDTPPAVSSNDTAHSIGGACDPWYTANGVSVIEFPNGSNDLNSIATQSVGLPSSNVETLTCSRVPSSTTCVQRQQLCNTPFATHSQTTPIHAQETAYLQQHVEDNTSELYLPSDVCQSNLLTIDNNNGAKFPNAGSSDEAQVCQRSLENQYGIDCERSFNLRFVDGSCSPGFTSQQEDFCEQIPLEQSVPESYNKFKYCSTTSTSTTTSGFNNNDENESKSQQEFIQEEFFSEHLDMSGLRISSSEEISYQHRHANPAQLPHVPRADIPPQQHIDSQPSVGMMHTTATTQSFQSSSDISLHSQTFSSFSSSSDKRNTVASSPSNNSSSTAENISPRVTTEIVNTTTNNAFCFTPIQSSSIVSPSCPYPNPSQSPKKMQRKGLSLDLSTALENQMKSLDLNSSRSDSAIGGTPQSAGSDKCFYNTQNTPWKNTPRNISFNSTFSTGKISDRLRARQDQLNSSLPLSYDSNSRQYGMIMSTVPSTPQKEFLQSSDTSIDQGNSEFGLPPQVRHSLDLSTSSNYSDSPSSSQSSSCEPVYQVFVPYTGWASYYASGAMWVLYNDGTQLGVKANEKTMTFIDQDGSQRKYNNKDVVPDIVKMKLEKFPSILNAVLNYQS